MGVYIILELGIGRGGCYFHYHIPENTIEDIVDETDTRFYGICDPRVIL